MAKAGIKVRGEWLKMYKTLHTWVGICSGLLLFVGFFAGALTMFEEPLQRWANPPQDNLRPASEMTTAELGQLVDTVLQQHPAARKDMTVHLQDGSPAPVVWHEGPFSRDIDLQASEFQASLDAQGQLQVRQYVPGQLAELIDQLHRSAGIPGDVGHDVLGVYLMGIAAFLYSLALVSGLVLVLPAIVRDFLVLRPEKSNKRFWLDAHNLIGITSLPFHLVIALTVVVFAFHDVFYDSMAELVYGEQPMFGSRGGAPASSYSIEALPPFNEILQNIEAEAPGFGIKSVDLFNLESARPAARVALSTDDFVTRGAREGYLVLNPYTGEVTNRNIVPGQEDVWSGLVATFFGIHFGSFGGLTMKWLYFLLGISGAFVFYSGNLLWTESRRKKLQQAQPHRRRFHSVTVMRALTNGVCLGVIAAVAAAMVVAKSAGLFTAVSSELLSTGSAGQGAVNQWLVNTYYAVFLGWLLWAWLRRMSPARNAIEMLVATALVIWLIPACGLLWLLLGHTQVSMLSLAVETTALVGGAGLMFWAQVLRRKQVDAADTVLAAG